MARLRGKRVGVCEHHCEVGQRAGADELDRIMEHAESNEKADRG